MKTLILISFITIILASSCNDQGNDRLTEKTSLEAEIQAKEQLKKEKELLEAQIIKQRELQEEQLKKEAELQRKLQEEQLKKERNATDTRSKELEARLKKMQDFYEDHSGHYEGTMTLNGDKINIRISLFPNLPRYSDTRVRTVSEVESDLLNLAYHLQIVQWLPGNSGASVGCRIEGAKPNIKDKTINLISKECPSSYFLNLSNTIINGTAQPSTNPEIFEVYAELKSKNTRRPK